MKSFAILPTLFIILMSAVFVSAIHELCDQNLVCPTGLYCRISGNPVYGTCEDPAHV
ncbi:hypothetical protein BD770DRAFT_468444 [Pilaira anomala]|nr:hypothetical protein BD770DRAFT_468444 [Pilaira anomala]